MRLGVIHYNAPGETLEEFLDYVADTGFECVELRSTDLWPEGVGDPKANTVEAKKMCDDRSLTVSAVSLGNDFVLLDDDAIAEQMERAKRLAELLLMCDCNVFRTEGGRPKDEVSEDRHAEAIIKSVTACLPMCEEMGVYLALDNHGVVSNNYELQLEVFKAVDSPHVGANCDTMNYRWFGYEVAKLPAIYEAIAPYVMHTHMKDGTGARGEYVGAALGDGEIPLDAALKAFKGAGYDGAYCAEYEGKEDSAIGYRKCLEWMRANIS